MKNDARCNVVNPSANPLSLDLTWPEKTTSACYGVVHACEMIVIL